MQRSKSQRVYSRMLFRPPLLSCKLKLDQSISMMLRYRTVSQHHGNRLIEFKFAGQQWRSKEHSRIDTLRFRALHLKWRGKTGDRETMLPVPRTLRQFGADRPANIDSCEQVRRWT